MGLHRARLPIVEAALFDGALVGEPAGDGSVIAQTCPAWFPAVVAEAGDVKAPALGQVLGDGDKLLIVGEDGPRPVWPGDWIIRGESGELVPCKPDLFAALFTPAE